MIAIILGIIAVITLAILSQKDAKKRGDEPADWYVRFEGRVFTFMGLLLAIVIDLVAWGIYAGVTVDITETTEIVTSVDLVALQDNSSVNGSFFLGSGSLNNKNYYAFYYETEHGYKYQTLDAESSVCPVYIKYIPIDEIPHIDQYSIVERKTMTADGSKSWLCSIIAWLNYGQHGPGDLISEEAASPALFGSDDANYYDNFRYVIYIPEGSIKTDYAIDLE